jgi:hypothetical protein
MTYSQPPHYSFGDPNDHQQSYQPQSPGAPGPSPQPPPQPPTASFPPPQPPGPPSGPLPAGPPPGGRSPAVAVLAIVSALCFVGAALFGILWFQADGKVEDAEELADERASTIEELEDDLEAAEGDLEAAEGELSDLEPQVEEIEAMQTCLDDLRDYYSTEIGSDEETEALAVVSETCAGYVF